MLRAHPVRWWVTTMLLVLVACSGAGDDAGCEDGTLREDVNDLTGGSGADTRDEAVGLELLNLDLEASDEAIGAAVAAAEPGEGGAETVEVTLEDGVVVTMTLVPLDPGWGIERSTWCEPA
jgi:hypothetical protein